MLCIWVVLSFPKLSGQGKKRQKPQNELPWKIEEHNFKKVTINLYFLQYVDITLTKFKYFHEAFVLLWITTQIENIITILLNFFWSAPEHSFKADFH